MMSSQFKRSPFFTATLAVSISLPAVADTLPHEDSKVKVTLPVIQVVGEQQKLARALQQEKGYRPTVSAASGFREMAVVDTPFSVSTLTAELMQNQQANSMADVIKNDASATLAGDPHWFERINLRGFNLGVDAIYRDGLSINDQGTIALENKAALELNKGLSALRYGATSPGGTLNYVVKRPTEEILREVTLRANEFGGLGLHADVGGRLGIGQDFGYRINAAAEELRSNMDAFTGDKQFISGAFDWRVNDILTLELEAEHQNMEKLSVNSPYLWWWGWDEDAAAVEAAQAVFDRLDATTYVSQPWAMQPNEQTYVSGGATFNLSPQWKTSFAMQEAKLWRDQNSSGVWDTVNAQGNFEDSIYYSPDQERNNRAFQWLLLGDVQTASVTHELAMGYDFIRRDMTWSDGVNIEIGQNNLFNPIVIPRPNVTVEDAGQSYLTNRTKQHAWFITNHLIISDQWRMYGGLRHTTIRQFRGSSPHTSLNKTYDSSAVSPSLVWCLSQFKTPVSTPVMPRVSSLAGWSTVQITPITDKPLSR